MAQIETERYVTTVNGKRYKLGAPDTPQLWAVELRMKYLSPRGHSDFRETNPVRETVYIEQETLLQYGLQSKLLQKKQTQPAPRTAEELILELLEYVGVYPSGGES